MYVDKTKNGNMLFFCFIQQMQRNHEECSVEYWGGVVFVVQLN